MTQQPMSISNQETAGLAIFYLVSKYPELPFKADAQSIQWQSLTAKEGIGIFTMQGAHYISKYISGSYKGVIPMRLIYKSNPTSNKGRKNASIFLGELANWLETCTATFQDEHMELESIERMSPVFKMDAKENGYEEYTCTINVKFYYKK
ncbi:MAG: hypothetical protein IKW81_00145 [Pseudobutyrivibrio sp.]|nr:hypothetical protein [Pseudobutyrivibrio sp.]